MTEKKIIRGMAKNNERALEVFIDVYGPLLKGVIARTLEYHPDLVEDALNEAFLAVWQNISSFDARRASFRTWCANIARYKAIDALRRESRFAVLPLDESINAADEANREKSAAEVDALLSELLAPLSAEDQAIFYDLFYNDESYQDVAKKTGLAKKTLYNRVSRGRKRLKNFYRKDDYHA